MKPWTDKEKTKLVELFYKGKSNIEIAIILKRPVSTISVYLCKLGLKRKSVLKDNFDELLKLKNEGLSISKIAKKFNINVQVLHNKFHLMKVKEQNNFHWSDQEKKQLESLVSRGVPIEALVIKLNKSKESIDVMMKVLKLKDLWVAECHLNQTIENALKDGISIVKLAAETNTSKDFLNKRILIINDYNKMGKQWNNTEIKTMNTMISEGVDKKEIAKTLGRTTYAVQKKSAKVKVKENTTNKNNGWTKELDTKLLSLFNQGKSLREIGKIMGRTEGAISVRKSFLNKNKFVKEVKPKINVTVKPHVFEEINSDMAIIKEVLASGKKAVIILG